MKTKTFGDKEITIREMSAKDLRIVKKWKKYINDLVDENCYLTVFKRVTTKSETSWIKEQLDRIKKKQEILLVAEDNGKIAGTSTIGMMSGKQNHIGLFGIAISNGYRGNGLGYFLTEEIIELAKKRFAPNLRIIELSVFSENDTAYKLYKKIGFNKVARITDRLRHNGKLMDDIIMHYVIKKNLTGQLS